MVRRRSQRRDTGDTLGCANFGAVNSTALKCLELAVLEHSKHRIKASDKMQADCGGRSSRSRAVSVDSFDSRLLKREQLPLKSPIERGRHVQSANGSHRCSRPDNGEGRSADHECIQQRLRRATGVAMALYWNILDSQKANFPKNSNSQRITKDLENYFRHRFFHLQQAATRVPQAGPAPRHLRERARSERGKRDRAGHRM